MAKRARHDLPAVQDRRARVVALRAEGKTWDQIAAAVGYSNGSAASKAWRVAIQQRPDQTVDEVRRQEKTRLEQMDSVMAGIIANPPLRGTATGAVMLDIRSCSCGSRSDKRRDHTEDCEIAPVVDAAAIIRASAERRALGESLRRLTGADAASAAPAVTIDQRSVSVMLLEINQDRALRGHPPLPAIPGFTE